MRKPFIIVVGHEKGGAGKSTMCAHVTVGLSYLLPHARITVLDLDMLQGTTYKFFEKRNNNTLIESPSINCFGLLPSVKDSKNEAAEEDLHTLYHTLQKLSSEDIIILDTPGSRSNFTSNAIFFSNVLLTPLNDSMIDIEMLLSINNQNHIVYGPYAETVFFQRKRSLIANPRKYFEWLLISNRINVLPTPFGLRRKELMENVAKNIGATYFGSLREHGVISEAFRAGYTVFDLAHHSISNNQIAVVKDFDNIIQYLNRVYEKICTKY